MHKLINLKNSEFPNSTEFEFSLDDSKFQEFETVQILKIQKIRSNLD